MKRLLFILIFIMLTAPLAAKVDPPNYDFSLDSLAVFMPGQSLQQAQKIHGPATKMSEASGGQIYRFMVEQLRYRFPVLVQVKGDQIDNFYAALPSYFLHDIFHQSLINRFGPQQIYKKVEESAVYIWENVKGNTHVYSGTCTITCFPVYYAVYTTGSTENLVKQLQDHSNYGKFLEVKPKPEETMAL